MDRQWLRPTRRRQRVAVLVAVAVATGIGLTQLPALHHGDASDRTAGEPAEAAGLLDEAAALKKARASGRTVEVTALRDASSTTWARPDGSFELETYAVPFRAEVDGRWREIDTDLHRTEAGDWAPAAVNNPVTFSGGSRGERAARSGDRTAVRTAAVRPTAVRPTTVRSTALPAASLRTTAAPRASVRTAAALTGTVPTPAVPTAASLTSTVPTAAVRTAGIATAAATAPAVAASAVAASAASDANDATDATDASSTKLATFSTGGHQLTLTWPGALPAPAVEGNRALYENVLPGVDLLLTARDAGFSHVLIVKNAEAAASPGLASLTYGLTSPDLTFTLDPGTHVIHAKDAEGEEVAVSPTPYMWDSAGQPAVTRGGDPRPPRPSEAPAPEADPDVDPSEEPEDTGGTPERPDWNDDTAAPQEDEPGPAAFGSGGTASAVRQAALTSAAQATRATRATRAASTTSTTSTAFIASAASAASAASTASPTPAGDGAAVPDLPGLAGPQPGTHDALVGITLDGGGSLTLTPDAGLLTADSTVYPVFIDPSFSGHTNNWTTAYQPHPGSSFWNGTNFNDGTDTARVGYESTTAGLSRSFFQIALSGSLKGAHVSSAYFYALETYSWSCSARSVQLWHTGSISSSTTWNNQPSWLDRIDSQNVAHGYSSGCPDNWVKFTATSLAQDAADNGWGYATLGLRAADETSAYPWKKFEASSSNSPYLKITYNRKPDEPTHQTMTPGPDCDISGESSVGKSDLTFAATATDPDGDLKYLDFELWQDGSSSKILDGNRTVDANGHASVTAAAARFTNGKTYWWRVRAIDSTGSASTYAPAGNNNCGFVYDASRPNSPQVASADFPEDDGTGAVWSTVPYGTAGDFTLSAAGSTDTVRYEFSFNSTGYGGSGVPAAPGGSVTKSLKPHHAGPNVFYVRAVDAAGNRSAGTKYLFYVTPRDTADAAGDLTGDGLPDPIVVDQYKNLRVYPSNSVGDLHAYNRAAYDRDGLVETNDAYPDDYWAGALLTHNGDFLPGDRLQDMVARMPDGRLYVYPGDGYGSFDVTRRTEILLPEGAPDPAALDQILAVGDLDGDRRPDLLATEGSHYWAFLGYTGGAFTEARLQSGGSAWKDRDLVSAGDHNGDGAADLVFRTLSSGRLTLRYGKPGSGGGTDVGSLAGAGSSLNGADTTYASSGWTTSAVRLLLGTPDANHDGVPDMWAVMNDGSVRMYSGGVSAVGSSVTVVSNGWDGKFAIG